MIQNDQQQTLTSYGDDGRATHQSESCTRFYTDSYGVRRVCGDTGNCNVCDDERRTFEEWIEDVTNDRLKIHNLRQYEVLEVAA